jgi:hypothetical protein
MTKNALTTYVGSSPAPPRPEQARAVAQRLAGGGAAGAFGAMLGELAAEQQQALSFVVDKVREHRAEVAQVRAVGQAVEEETEKLRSMFAPGSNGAPADVAEVEDTAPPAASDGAQS